MGTRDWITTACKNLGLESSVRLVEPHRYRAILELIITERTTLSEGAVSALWWWEALREPVAYLQHEIRSQRSRAWSRKMRPFGSWPKLPDKRNKATSGLYESSIGAVCAVLRDCPSSSTTLSLEKWTGCCARTTTAKSSRAASPWPPCSVRPNPSLERTSTGLALGPRTGQCHHPLRGPSANPAGSAQLKR